METLIGERKTREGQKLAALVATGGSFWYAAHKNRERRKARKAARKGFMPRR